MMRPMTPDLYPVFVAANRAAVYGTVSRWLLHHLRNPAQAISLVSELLQHDTTGSPSDLWTSLHEATEHLTGAIELVERTLRTPSRSADIEPVALPDILSFIAAAYQTQKSSVLLDVGPALAARVPAVAGREDHLEHALLNLVMNAVEALSGRETGHILVSTAARETAVEITVEDDGPGVPPDLRDRLFEPFVTDKVERPTAGLGLAVARHLLQQCGGTVTYLSTPGPGSTFLVRLRRW